MYLGTEELHEPSSKEPAGVEITGERLANILEEHGKWVESRGETGERADLSRADLDGADLPGVNLQWAFLRKANLSGADLLLADLQGACLMQANLQGANLLGTELREANLQGATLDGVTGLLTGRLAGANLFGAVLPKPIAEFGELELVGRISKNARKLLAVMLLLSAGTCSVIATTTDVQLLGNLAPLPLRRLGNAIPMVGFYLFWPVLLFGFYLYFHLYLQRLWNSLSELPAIFPDGRALNQTGPWLLMALARGHVKWLSHNRSALSFLETWISRLLAYWVVPATLVLLWARYLTRQDFQGTMLHVLLVVAAVAAAAFLPDLVGRTLRGASPQLEPSNSESTRKKVYRCAATALGLGLILSLLSLGTIYGAPRDTNRAPELKAIDIRRWAANVLWVVGYSPYADLTEMDISPRPKDWSGREEELALIKGVRLNKLNIRYAEGYRVFLANAHLLKADLEGAYLSEADLRGAIFRQANLQSAVLDRALIARANLSGARLRNANLARADMREADLSYSSLTDAILVGARLEGANLYASDLQRARLVRANLQRADLRDANLEDSNLAVADLREAYLWSAKLHGARLHDAQLQHAMLIEADMRGTDLRGADLQGAILRGADLRGANLEGADFRGATGLSAEQVCSAMARRGVLLDESLQHMVENQCGSIR